MHVDALQLKEFYATPLGSLCLDVLKHRVNELWPDLAGLTLLGLGYTFPYLSVFENQAERIIAAMPASQGAMYWPASCPNRSVLVDERDLPFPDMSIDRAILAHVIETSESLRPLLREIWRVLPSGGRVIAIVPNRRGLWARRDMSPFSHGTPYTVSQIKQTLREAQFIPERVTSALFTPPSRSLFFLHMGPFLEKIGARWLRNFSGVHIIEASKQVYAVPLRKTEPVRSGFWSPALPWPTASRKDSL